MLSGFLHRLFISQQAIIYYFIVAVFFFVGMLGFWSSGYLRRKKMLRLMKKGRKLEERGAILLQASGYRILQSQPSKTSRVVVDRKAFDKVVRADFLVKKGLKRYIVEVKGGDLVRDPTSGATRRQLFEYYSCFQTPNMLFVDAVEGKIHKIAFPDLHKRGFVGFMLGFIVGAALFWFLFRCLNIKPHLLTFLT